MKLQFTRKQIIKPLAIGTMILGIGSFNLQPAAAQVDRNAMREMAEELDLSRSQMRQLAGVMRSFRSEIEDILTSEQLELLQAAREELQSQTQAQIQNAQELKEALDLTEEQTEQLAEARRELVDELQNVLTSEQIESLLEMTILSQI
ncbi:MAG: hypothetical protein VKL39_17945 [Leptolyngbyaceae bacterium]|nr:hypothetical protein [Leptolyngbyaceae bacterium]